MAYEEYTDEELMQMAGDEPDIGGYSDYSDEELMAMAGTRPPSGATRSWEDDRPLSVNRLNEDLVKRGVAIEGTLSAPSDENIFQTLNKVPGRVLDIMGDVAGFGVDIAMQGAEHAYKNIFDPESQETISRWGRELFAAPPVSAGESLEESFGYVPGRTVKTLGEAYGKLKETFPEGVKHAEALGNIAMATPILKGVGKVTELAGITKEIGGDIAKEIYSRTPEQVEKALGKVVTKGIEKGIRPTVVGKGNITQIEGYNERAKTAVKEIIGNKDNLILTDAEGNIIEGALPQSLKQFSEAIDQTKRGIFRQYDDLTAAAGEQGAAVDLGPAVRELEGIAKQTTLQDLNPEIVKYAGTRAEALAERGAYTTAEAQDAITQLNKSLEAFYKNPSYENATKAGVDSVIANNIRKSLDEVIENVTEGGYQELKNSYGALKTIEKEVAHRTVVDARKNIKGLLDFTDIYTSGEFIAGLATMNPAMMAKAGLWRGIKEWLKLQNNPNRIVKNMFRDAEKILNSEERAFLRPESTQYPTRGFRGNERLGTRAIAYDPFEDVTPRIRAPYEYPPQLPPGQGFTFPDQKLLRAPYETPPQITGQGFDLYGESLGGPYHPEWLPVVSQATGEGFTSVPRSSTSGTGPMDTTRAALRPEIGRPPTKFGVSDIESPISQRGVIPPGEVPPFATRVPDIPPPRPGTEPPPAEIVRPGANVEDVWPKEMEAGFTHPKVNNNVMRLNNAIALDERAKSWGNFLEDYGQLTHEAEGHKLYDTKPAGIQVIVGPDGSVMTGTPDIMGQGWAAVLNKEVKLKNGFWEDYKSPESQPGAPSGGKQPLPIGPKKLTQEIQSEPGYVYHATNSERLSEIADTGILRTHKPGEFTDQGSWPDGSTQKRAYFSNKANVVWQFAPEEGNPVVIRTKGAGLKEEIAGDVYSNKPISIDNLEYLGKDDIWHPVSELKSPEVLLPKDKGPGTAGMTFREAQELFRRKR